MAKNKIRTYHKYGMKFMTDNTKFVKITIPEKMVEISYSNSIFDIDLSILDNSYLTAIAKCNPKDTFDLYKGELIAYENLMEKIYQKFDNITNLFENKLNHKLLYLHNLLED